MYIFRTHKIQPGSYVKVKNLYTVKLEEGVLPTRDAIEEQLGDAVDRTIEARFSFEVCEEMVDATAREASMDSYYKELKPGEPVQCVGRRTRKKHKCVICMRRKKTKIKLRCKHAFHRECIDHWARYKRFCPTCQAPLELKSKPDTGDNCDLILSI